MIKRICAAFILGSFVLTPIAYADSEKVKLKGTTCYGTLHKVSCGYIGEVTVDQIYEKGWRVVSFVKEGPNSVSLIIEEQEK